jgi:hypothetical protein
LAPAKAAGFEQVMKHGTKCFERECLGDDIGPPPALKVELSEGQICDFAFSIK